MAVKKGGAIFTEARAVGLGWEFVFRRFFCTGALTAGPVALRNGGLEVLSGKRWYPKSAVDVLLTDAQNAFLLERVKADRTLLWSKDFWVTDVDVQKRGKGSGFFLFGLFHPSLAKGGFLVLGSPQGER